MSKVFQNIKLQNNVHRNAFDLSYRHVTSAPVGALLPIMCKEVLPGDNFRIGLQHLTRTMPLNTATFARMTEYFHFFFVPTRLLDKDFQGKVMDNVEPLFDTPAGAKKFPIFETASMYKAHFNVGAGNSTTKRDMFGYATLSGCSRLMSMLGYPSLPKVTTEEIAHYDAVPDWEHQINPGVPPEEPKLDYISFEEKVIGVNRSCSPYLLAGYQRIWQDFYRNNIWTKRNPKAYDCSYYSTYSLKSTGYYLPDDILFELGQMRYAPLKRDMLSGLYPSQQFGDVAIAPSILDPSKGSISGTGTAMQWDNLGIFASSTNRGRVPFGPSVIDIRKAEALQKYREITMTAGKLYGEQVKAHYDQGVSDTRQQVVEYIGGTSSVINVDEVISQAQTRNGDNGADLGDISGKGISASNRGNLVNYEAQEHGYIYCIYHCQPLIDYTANNISLNGVINKFSPEDYAIPELDSIGFEPHYINEFTSSVVGSSRDELEVVGYSPRYMAYKTSMDIVSGGMLTDGLRPWSVQLDANAILKNENFYRYVSPSLMKDVFVANYDGTTLTDHLILDIYLDVKAVRPLSVFGLPY